MDAYIGEIRLFAGNFAPRHWAFCDGQMLDIANYQALYSLLGTTYGGDGSRTFALPDFRGRLPVHAGHGPGLSPVRQGQQYGMETVTLNGNQIPNHNHPLQASQDTGTATNPTQQVLSKTGDGGQGFVANPAPSSIKQLADQAVLNAGQNEPHTNLMPSLCVSFIICLNGYFPPRN